MCIFAAEADQRVKDRIAELEAELAAARAELREEQDRYRELRHRIRNDLQGLASLLSAQAKANESPECCGRCILRLRSAAELHNALDEDGNSRVQMDAYLRALAEARRKAFEDRVEAEIFLEDGVRLDHRSAQCVGLVYIEAVTNVMKHAFPDGKPGRIEVSFRREEGELRLTVADNGVGFDPAVAVGGDGVELMRSLARQLKGEVRFERMPRGAVVRLVFPAPSD